MAQLFPFKAKRPRLGKALQVASLPYDQYTANEVTEILKYNPDSFLHVVQPSLLKGRKSTGSEKDLLFESRNKYFEMLEKGALVPDEKACFYVYRQEKADFIHTGIIAAIQSTEYKNGSIKIHEQTLAAKEEKLKDYLSVVGINAEPVLFTYPAQHELDVLINEITSEAPVEHFEKDGKKHSLWVVWHDNQIDKIHQIFEGIEHVYVADGHHRSASSALLSESLMGKFVEDHPSQRFMGIFFPHHNVQLFEFNRLVKDLNGLTLVKLLNLLSEDFEIENLGHNVYKPKVQHEFGMYIDKNWYKLKLKSNTINPELGEKLDANILNQKILQPIFGIKDLRREKRMGYLTGKEPIEKLEQMVNEGKFKVAFTLFPVSVEQFFHFSDEGKMMPPKTTWFEPKLLNAFVVYDLELPNEQP